MGDIYNGIHLIIYLVQLGLELMGITRAITFLTMARYTHLLLELRNPQQSLCGKLQAGADGLKPIVTHKHVDNQNTSTYTYATTNMLAYRQPNAM